MKKKFIAISITILSILTLTACSSKEPSVASTDAKTTEAPASKAQEEVAIDTNNLTEIVIGFPSAGADWAGGEVAIANLEGYFDEYVNPLGYKVTLTGFTGAGPAVNDALASKDIDLAYYAELPGIVSKSNGVDTTLLLVTTRHGSSEIVVSEDSDIKTLKDLKGKKIGYSRGTTIQEYLFKALASVGLTEGDVELVNLTAAESSSALLTGAIDANASVLVVTQALVTKNNAQVIASSNDNEEYAASTVLIGRTKFVQENEAATVAVIKALIKAKEKIVSDPEAFYEISAEKSGVSIETIIATSGDDDVSFPSIANSLDQKYLDYLSSSKQFLLDYELITKDFSIEDWADSTYLEKAIED